MTMQNKNLLTEQGVLEMEWENPASNEVLSPEGLRVYAPQKCDFFQDPAAVHIQNSAPFLFTCITGDFAAKIHLSHDFVHVWDAGALMIKGDDRHWAKLCFEATDFGTRAIVSVVTDGVSDDANGVNYHWSDVWLQIVRRGNIFGMHYGPDGVHWNMVRYFTLDLPDTIQVGLVAQCPGGTGTAVDFHYFGIEPKTVNDIRAGL